MKSSQVNHIEQTLIQTDRLPIIQEAWLRDFEIDQRFQHKIFRDREKLNKALKMNEQVKAKNIALLNSLEKKVHLLQEKQRISKKQALNLRLRTFKIKQAEYISTLLLKQQQNHKQLQQIENYRKKQACSEIKFENRKKIQISKSYYRESMLGRINCMREERKRSNQSMQKSIELMVSENKKQYIKIKEQQNRLRNKMKRNQQYKLMRARKNYLDKIQGIMQTTKQKQYHLKQLELTEHHQLQLLKKTQELQKSSRKYEDSKYNKIFPTAI